MQAIHRYNSLINSYRKRKFFCLSTKWCHVTMLFRPVLCTCMVTTKKTILHTSGNNLRFPAVPRKIDIDPAIWQVSCKSKVVKYSLRIMFETLCKSVRSFALATFSKTNIPVTDEKAEITAAFNSVWVQGAKKRDCRHGWIFKIQLYFFCVYRVPVFIPPNNQKIGYGVNYEWNLAW